MMRYSPLRYPGGKGKISSFFSELFVANNLIGGTYIEPYVGGGSIALSLLINGVANQIIINDKDRSLFAFWYSILNYTDEFCQLIENTPITIDTWYEQREIQKNKTNAELLSLGFSTFFYNPQIQISAESETKRSIFREKDKTKRSKKESAQHSKSRNKSFVMTSVSAL